MTKIFRSFSCFFLFLKLQVTVIKHSTQDNISQFSCNNPNVLSTKKVGISKCQKEWTEQNWEHQNNDRQLLGQTTQIKQKSTFKWTYAEWGEMT
jgi:hypothetical protein